MSSFLLPPATCLKFATSKENYEAFPRARRVILVKDNTISSSKLPKLNIKLITYMNNYNGFDLIVAVLFVMSTQLGDKAQDLLIYFRLGEGETPPQFHLIDIQIRNEIFLLQYETGQINNLTGKYIVEL